MMQALEFRSAEDLAAHYAAVRQRLGARKARPILVRRELVETREERFARLYDTIYLAPIGPQLPRQPRRPTRFRRNRVTERILRDCAERHGVTVEDIMGVSRRPTISHARQQVCWELREVTGWSLKAIANFMGYDDHTTVLHGIRQHQARLDAGEAP